MARKLIFLFVFGLAGCTVTPKTVAPQVSAFSGNEANAGLISLGPPPHVTASWVTLYDSLVKVYGATYSPPIKVGDGLTPVGDGTYLVDNEHLSAKNVMKIMLDSGIPP